jgi:hypothetical protein
MKVISYICDICGNPFGEADLQRITLAGSSAEIDTACLKALNTVTKDTPKWKTERDAAVAAIEAEKAAAEAEVKP